MTSRERKPYDGCPKDYNPKEAEKKLEEQIKNSKSAVVEKIDSLGRNLMFFGLTGMVVATAGVLYENFTPPSDYDGWYYVALMLASGLVFRTGLSRVSRLERSVSGLENKVEK